jgi:hypothetical protein
MKVINKGLGESDTDDWASNTCRGNPPAGACGGTNILSGAISAFQASGVDIVHIMLGANDVES